MLYFKKTCFNQIQKTQIFFQNNFYLCLSSYCLNVDKTQQQIPKSYIQTPFSILYFRPYIQDKLKILIVLNNLVKSFS